jgi:hypothetical protein
VFLNDNIWLATAFALGIVAAAFGLLFLLAWLEPSQPAQMTPSRARPVTTRVVERAPGQGTDHGAGHQELVQLAGVSPSGPE